MAQKSTFSLAAISGRFKAGAVKRKSQPEKVWRDLAVTFCSAQKKFCSRFLPKQGVRQKHAKARRAHQREIYRREDNEPFSWEEEILCRSKIFLDPSNVDVYPVVGLPRKRKDKVGDLARVVARDLLWPGWKNSEGLQQYCPSKGFPMH
jgi:hypothetical protein